MNPLTHGMTPKMKPLAKKRTTLVAALDVGTSKITCLIARLKPQTPQAVLRRRTHKIEVIGFSHIESIGMKAGQVVDLTETEEAVRRAVDLAERNAKCQVEAVIVSLSAGRLGSERRSVPVDLAGAAVGERDIARAIAAGSRVAVRDGRVLLHALPTGYSLGDAHGIRDPRGMLAEDFAVDVHSVTADAAPALNLMLAVERCHLGIEALVAGPLVASLATLADDEADLGAAVIDIGAGTTTAAVLVDGQFVHCDGFALGGRHVTLDIARGLGIGLPDSERIKTLYGSVLAGSADERDMITMPGANAEEREAARFLSRADLTRIIKPRAEEILEMVRDRLAASPFGSVPQGRVILTGGGSQQTGLCDLAGRILGRQARIGRPLGISGLPEVAKGPAFAVACGLLVYPQLAHLEHFEPRHARQPQAGTSGYIARVGRWLRESF